MSRSLLILRPEPGNSESVARAHELEISTRSCPLFEVVPEQWQPLPSSQFDAVLFTSANALHCAGPALGDYLHLPAYAVGPATADATRRAGFEQVITGQVDVEDVMTLAGTSKLLHFCGADVVDIDSTTLTRRTVYSSQIVQNPPRLHQALAVLPVTALHSARAARRFYELVGKSATPRTAIAVVAISAKVAAAAGDGWQEVAIAAKPRDEDVLQAAIRLIQKTKAQAF